MQYTVIIEKAGDNYSAYVPDLPGCVAVADTPDEVLDLMREAIEFHLEGQRLDTRSASAAWESRCETHV